MKSYWKKSVAAIAAVTMLSFASGAFAAKAPAEKPAPAATPAAAAAEPQITINDMVAQAREHGYKYVSHRYGYTVICPFQPNVIPLSVLGLDNEMYAGAKGEVLIFDNEGYNIHNAWIISIDAFKEGDVPRNPESLNDKQKADALNKFLDSAMVPYQEAYFADLGHTQGVYCITAKEVIDPKTKEVIATADTQEIHTWFYGQLGGHFVMNLVDNPELNPNHIAAYQVALMTFEETQSTKAPQPAAKK